MQKTKAMVLGANPFMAKSSKMRTFTSSTQGQGFCPWLMQAEKSELVEEVVRDIFEVQDGLR